ncbi:hypothetical protein [Chryseobacterium flavum]|uniref:hypothetical protein n=1 Tax=Chryseobacterium flavum TaxID=415851 RepID=UPI0028AD0512|nr:hypothetical protein [Chryseobacterium flavum]
MKIILTATVKIKLDLNQKRNPTASKIKYFKPYDTNNLEGYVRSLLKEDYINKAETFSALFLPIRAYTYD